MDLTVVSFHYPPSTAVGGNRPHSLVKYIGEMNIRRELSDRVDVYCAADVEPRFLTDAHGLISVHRVPAKSITARRPSSAGTISGAPSNDSRIPSLNTLRLGPLLGMCRAWLKKIVKPIAQPVMDLSGFPDRYQDWASQVHQAICSKLNRQSVVPLLLSSGPPHSAHLAACRIREVFGGGWVMDLRDPWISNPFRNRFTQPAEYLDKRWERRCMLRADAVVVNTETALETLRTRYGSELGEKAVCIPNGYDEEDFEGLVPQPLWPTDSRKTMLYAGSLYGPRSGAMLLDAFISLSRKGISVPRLVILGSNDEKANNEMQQRMEATGRGSDVIILPGVSKRQALSAMASSDVLVLIGDNMPSQLQVPSKLFEYLRIGKPILALYPSHSPVIRYLERYSANYWQVTPNDSAGIESVIAEIGRVDRGTEATAIDRNGKHGGATAPHPICEISREIQNQKLYDILRRMDNRQEKQA